MACRLKRAADDEGTSTSKRQASCQSNACCSQVINSFANLPTVVNIRALSLEDRADAVISSGKQSWTLANLSKWRHKTLNIGSDSNHLCSETSSKEILRQRQRAYRHWCIASSKKHHNI
ncbi:uncharacterized protein PHALS_11536 [Plasmopara halstedii]|uniref:Uncharacterized protein n=1 Tax=Plasmopara halstedii TaxID=4781 RepID=A0A0P1A6B2_PLAHL|nr:uncharacterized protein PHALS_11536 [Plasmopara halstedii]CEG35668.1 hypothetical protein PHALS_11536 [Plasmopara halstedii]|eukprot:XP_024572037.1 hypothetical protein PHALS_11536 [Plasmopara halstedii]